MNCEDQTPTLKDLSKTEIIRILKKERNEFAKSRQEWIRCAFSMYNGMGNNEFYRMIRQDLCDKCIKTYHDESTK